MIFVSYMRHVTSIHRGKVCIIIQTYDIYFLQVHNAVLVPGGHYQVTYIVNTPVYLRCTFPSNRVVEDILIK